MADINKVLEQLEYNYCSRCGTEIEDGVDLCDKCMYEAQVEYQQYCELYEQTYNPEDGSM